VTWITTSRVLPRFDVWVVVLLVGCAQPSPTSEPKQESTAAPLALPATYAGTPGCAGCLAVTLTLRPDGGYLVRERIGESEFYDFGRWQRSGDSLELVGGRDAPRHYVVRGEDLDSQPGTTGGDLKRASQVEALRGPFRMTGLYDGTTFRECRTGLAWRLSETRAAETLHEEFRKMGGGRMLAALDAQFEGSPERLRVLRPAALLFARACP
jgi:hypothetical protein